MMRIHRGFTLVELLVAIAMLAILLGVGVPSMIDFIETNRRAAAINALITDIQRARNTATSSAMDVALCASPDGNSCTLSGTPDWAGGWLVFADANGNGLRDTGEERLALGNPREGVKMPSNRNVLRFSPGYRVMPSFGGTVAVCVGDPEDHRWIVIGTTGRPRLDDSNADVGC